MINHLFIAVFRLCMKTRDAEIINLYLKRYSVDWEENNKFITFKHCFSAKKQDIFSKKLISNLCLYFFSQNILIIKYILIIK